MEVRIKMGLSRDCLIDRTDWLRDLKLIYLFIYCATSVSLGLLGTRSLAL